MVKQAALGSLGDGGGGFEDFEAHGDFHALVLFDDLGDGDELDAGVFAAHEFMFVEADAFGFVLHALGGGLEGEEDSEFGAFAVAVAAVVAVGKDGPFFGRVTDIKTAAFCPDAPVSCRCVDCRRN